MRITTAVWYKWRKHRAIIYFGLFVYVFFMSFFGGLLAWYTNMWHSIIHDEVAWAILGSLFFPVGMVRGALMLMGVI